MKLFIFVLFSQFISPGEVNPQLTYTFQAFDENGQSVQALPGFNHPRSTDQGLSDVGLVAASSVADPVKLRQQIENQVRHSYHKPFCVSYDRAVKPADLCPVTIVGLPQ